VMHVKHHCVCRQVSADSRRLQSCMTSAPFSLLSTWSHVVHLVTCCPLGHILQTWSHFADLVAFCRLGHISHCCRLGHIVVHLAVFCPLGPIFVHLVPFCPLGRVSGLRSVLIVAVSVCTLEISDCASTHCAAHVWG